MSNELKEAAQSIASHPKVTVAATALFTSNAWLDYGEPIIKALTGGLGVIVLLLLVIKHGLDIKKTHFSKDK